MSWLLFVSCLLPIALLGCELLASCCFSCVVVAARVCGFGLYWGPRRYAWYWLLRKKKDGNGRRDDAAAQGAGEVKAHAVEATVPGGPAWVACRYAQCGSGDARGVMVLHGHVMSGGKKRLFITRGECTRSAGRIVAEGNVDETEAGTDSAKIEDTKVESCAGCLVVMSAVEALRVKVFKLRGENRLLHAVAEGSAERCKEE